MPFSSKQLENYVTFFDRELRENVLKELLEMECLSNALQTTEGKAVLDGLVDEIARSTKEIVKFSRMPDAPAEPIKDHAKNINIAYNLLWKYANVLTKGEEHLKGIEDANGGEGN